MTRKPNLLPRTLKDNPRCRPICINPNGLFLRDDYNPRAWLGMEDAVCLRKWS